MTDKVYILNTNPAEVDVLHSRAGLTEECNTDQVEGRQLVDADTADALVQHGDARFCQHCGVPPDAA